MYFKNNQEIKWFQHKDLKSFVSYESSQILTDSANADVGYAGYENHDSFDIFYFNIPEDLRDMSKSRIANLGFYISRTEVICAYTFWDEEKQDIIESIVSTGISKNFSNRKILLSIIDYITKDDGKVLGKLEDCIAALEDRVIHSSNDTNMKEGIHEISSIKQSLLPLKQIYEQLIDALEELMEDENDMYSEGEIKYCTRIYSRVERLYKTVINLRDYVTQTREAYQAQIDISLNSIMKIFTVISAVFLPLTFLVGWYGMNFQTMPEIPWKYGYITFIALTVIIVLGCFILFKKKKWF